MWDIHVKMARRILNISRKEYLQMSMKDMRELSQSTTISSSSSTSACYIISRTIVRWFEFYGFLAIFIQMNEFMQHMPYNKECFSCTIDAKLNLHLKRISSRYQGTSNRISNKLPLFQFVSYNKLLFCLSMTFL